MPGLRDMLTVKEAADELGITRTTVRRAVMNGTLSVHRLDDRTYLVPRGEVERYRREHLGQRGKRKKKPAEPANKD